MPSDRQKLRVRILAEDKRTERFFRKLLKQLGFGRLYFDTAPKGIGSAEAWVAKRYPDEVRVLRSKNFQRSLRLIAVRDADGDSLDNRKKQLDQALQSAGLPVRKPGEGIATPVPARNIETWLLALLGDAELDETKKYKHRFEDKHGAHEASAHDKAALAWKSIDETSLHSLRDGKTEIKRIDP